MASLGIIGCHVAGDFFLGIDILVSAMLVNFLLMAITVLTLPSRNPPLAQAVTVIPSRALRSTLAGVGVAVLALFLAMHTWKDLTAAVTAWYFRSTYLWAVVLAAASAIYFREVRAMRRRGVDVDARFKELPID
jgi:APA family basic amino acid/polyamine antiporter